jgi:hypothetical protein
VVVDEIYMDDKIKDYIVDLVQATRDPGRTIDDLDGLIDYGASPRATIFLALAARANAFLDGRGYVTPQDVKDDRASTSCATASSSATRPRLLRFRARARHHAGSFARVQHHQGRIPSSACRPSE